MLDKFSKIVLNTLIKNGFTYPQPKFVSIKETLIPLLPPRKDIHWSLETLTPIIQYLHLHGYVDYIEHIHGYYPVKDCHMLYTTHKGTYYKNFKWLVFEEFICKSVLVPMAISLITALITLLLSH